MLAPRWLLGIEADASWSDIDHTEHFDSFGQTVNAGITEKHAYSVRGRFGYLLTPNTLLYATGGWSWSQFGLSLTSTNFDGTPGPGEGKTLNLSGPEVGFGVETQLGGGWNARLEYLEAFYDNAKSRIIRRRIVALSAISSLCGKSPRDLARILFN
jgi:outer membrane immunogenic protein